ncbi:MAG: bifunctional (p)ppGpp synthetase/guanosine-3',5'-bis(diphosphate) 3'-pyrophosphohydrolase [Myxococcales bacterium]|nr:bifunctional (p)ppGpp synthetase/guanosine-3',5'-bis(diphosphate) 3'-pyrophosphohydrolase [Myxococcales bacterium]
MLKLADVIRKIEAVQPDADLDMVKRAYAYASEKHEGQTRKSGEPYITHPLAVADLLADLNLDVPSVCAAILHDTIEDTSATYDEVSTLFSKEIADLVDGVTKLGKLRFRNKEERQAESFRKMLLAMSKDIRVILVKLADRLHNMRTLGHIPVEKALGIASETRDIFAPLANRLGIQWMRTELEDLCFRYTEPDAYQLIRSKVNERRSDREAYIELVRVELERLMAVNKLEVDISGRPKHFYSIYRKMRDHNIEYEQVYDTIAFRIIVPEMQDCYAALGYVHSSWRPVPGRFKDYIGMPKPNHYQSLHTAVMGPHNRRMEVQIRTRAMHEIAENGIAAHWKYKERGPISAQDEQRFGWLRQLLEYQRELDDPTDFFEAVKDDLFQAEIYVFTPKGDLKVLPKGATPVDFAYAVHSEVGQRCAGAVVNHAMVTLDHPLRSGDTCSIITKTDQRPSADWLKFVRTGRAKARIRQFVRLAERTESHQLGTELLERALRKYKRSIKAETKAGRLEPVAHDLKTASISDLLVHIGYGKVTTDEVIDRIVPEDERKKTVEKPDGPIKKIIKAVTGAQDGIRVDGLEDVVTHFGKCCNPVLGDAISGYVTNGRGVSIHADDCRVLKDIDPKRRIEVYWDGKGKSSRPSELLVISANVPGLLASISQSFSEYGINITGVACKTDALRALNSFEIMVDSLSQLRGVMRAIERIPGVHAVQRVRH